MEHPNMKFEAYRATAIDRDRGVEIVQPRLERGAYPGEVEMQYSVYFDDRVEGIGCFADVEGADGGKQTWLIRLAPSAVLASLIRIKRSLGNMDDAFSFIVDMAGAMTLVYERGYDVYEPTDFFVLVDERSLREQGIAIPDEHRRFHTGELVIGHRHIEVSFENQPVTDEQIGGGEASKVRPQSIFRDPGDPEYVFSSGRDRSGRSNFQNAFDYVSASPRNAGTLFHTPFGRSIDNARSDHELTAVARSLRDFLDSKGIRPFLGKYRNSAVDVLMNTGCRRFATEAVEGGQPIVTFIEGMLPDGRFAHTDLPALLEAEGLIANGVPLKALIPQT